MPIHHDTNAMQNAQPKDDTYDTQELPKTNSRNQTHTKFTPQASKGGLVKWFGENIG